MWNSKALNEEAGGKAWIHDISFYKDVNTPRQVVRRPPPTDRIVHGRCLPTPWIPTYPFDPYRRPNAPDTTGRRSSIPTHCQMPKNECGTSTSTCLDAEFEAFETPDTSKSVVIIDPTNTEDGRPCDDPCSPCDSGVPCTTDECVKDNSCQPPPIGTGDRTHFDDVKNTECNRKDRYKVVPPWWNGERDDSCDDTPLNATVKKPDHAHLDPNREIGVNCYAAAGLVTRPTLELPKPVRTFQGCPPGTAPPLGLTGRESKIVEFLGSHVARFDYETFPHYITRCAMVAKNELKKCRRLNVGHECCEPVDQFVTRLYIGSRLGQAAHGVNWSMKDACDVQRYLKEECRKMASQGAIDLKILSF